MQGDETSWNVWNKKKKKGSAWAELILSLSLSNSPRRPMGKLRSVIAVPLLIPGLIVGSTITISVWGCNRCDCELGYICI